MRPRVSGGIPEGVVDLVEDPVSSCGGDSISCEDVINFTHVAARTNPSIDLAHDLSGG